MDVTRANQALAFEAWAYNHIVKQPDTAENFRASYELIKRPLITAALPFRAEVPRPTFLPPRVGFFLPSASMLAHTVNLRTFLTGMNRLDQKPIECLVYTTDKPRPDFDTAFRDVTVRHCVGRSAAESWLAVREQAMKDGLAAMVFVSVVQGVPFAVTMTVAPKHIWWAHKWHGLELDGLDYIDGCHPFQDEVEIDGRRWRSTYTALPELLDTAQTERARTIRETFDGNILFGWMGREEKLTPEYAIAVASILKAVPGSGFVYTAKNPDHPFRDWMGAAGMGERIQCVGWVNTRLWAQVLDVYLDTFPFQSGHCAYEAMAASKPVVWLHDPVMAEEQSASGLVESLWYGTEGSQTLYPLAPWVATADAYVDRAVTLANDPNLRERMGTANRLFLNRFMRDEKRMAESVSSAILEIVHGPRNH